jgi:hypothetical protein
LGNWLLNAKGAAVPDAQTQATMDLTPWWGFSKARAVAFGLEVF